MCARDPERWLVGAGWMLCVCVSLDYFTPAWKASPVPSIKYFVKRLISHEGANNDDAHSWQWKHHAPYVEAFTRLLTLACAVPAPGIYFCGREKYVCIKTKSLKKCSVTWACDRVEGFVYDPPSPPPCSGTARAQCELFVFQSRQKLNFCPLMLILSKHLCRLFTETVE